MGAVVSDAVDGCAWDGVPEPGGVEDGAGELVAGRNMLTAVKDVLSQQDNSATEKVQSGWVYLCRRSKVMPGARPTVDSSVERLMSEVALLKLSEIFR